jgi:hypothetical protein
MHVVATALPDRTVSYLEQTDNRLGRSRSRELAPATSCSCESSAYLIRGDSSLGPISGVLNDRPNLPESQSTECIRAGHLDIVHLRPSCPARVRISVSHTARLPCYQPILDPVPPTRQPRPSRSYELTACHTQQERRWLNACRSRTALWCSGIHHVNVWRRRLPRSCP